MGITDEVHGYDRYERDGTLKTHSMGRKRSEMAQIDISRQIFHPRGPVTNYGTASDTASPEDT